MNQISGAINDDPSTDICPLAPEEGSIETISGQVSKICSPTPRIMGAIFQDGRSLGSISILPDSGSVCDIMSHKLASNLGLHTVSVDPNNYRLPAANGNKIEIIARAIFQVTLTNSNNTQEIECLISNDINGPDLIISWETMNE